MSRRRIPTKSELMRLQKLYRTDKRIAEILGNGVTEQLVAYWRRKKGVLRYSFPKFSENEIRAVWDRFGDDFQPPAKVTGHRDVLHWTIGRAGYWPDIARSQPFYNRPSWHYQLGSSLTIGNNVNVPATPGPVSPDATLESKDLHIAQAVELCRSVLRDQSRSDGDRALAICWLAHLVADAHQPCHAGSLYVDGIFPDGDRGANSIPTKQGRNMHAL